jgi:hypothetical protein
MHEPIAKIFEDGSLFRVQPTSEYFRLFNFMCKVKRKSKKDILFYDGTLLPFGASGQKAFSIFN